MGYSTDFEGSFKFSKPLTVTQYKYLVKFAETRHVKKFLKMTETLPSKELKELNDLGLDIGLACEYYLGDRGEVKDSNVPPATQPGLYCQWVPNEDGTELQWDGSEEFYHYVEWLEYYIKNFFNRWDIKLNGTVEFWGEREGDRGFIIVKDNVVLVSKTLEENTKTTATEELPFSIQQYIRKLLGKKITSIRNYNTDILFSNGKLIGPNLRAVSEVGLMDKEIVSVSIFAYSYNQSIISATFYLELRFKDSLGSFLVPMGATIEIV
jgi:hypothetical protein